MLTLIEDEQILKKVEESYGKLVCPECGKKLSVSFKAPFAGAEIYISCTNCDYSDEHIADEIWPEIKE